MLSLLYSPTQSIRLSIYWGSWSTGSQLVHHLGPIWFSCIYIVSYGHVILLKVVPCPLPSCFRYSVQCNAHSQYRVSAKQNIPDKTPYLGSCKYTLPLRLSLFKIYLLLSIWLNSSYTWANHFWKYAKRHCASFLFSLLLREVQLTTFKVCPMRHVSYFEQSFLKCFLCQN